MKYFLDTEFLEGSQDKKLFGVTIGKTKPTIDFISIGIVSEDDREYYAISKDFNLKEAWNRFDLAEPTFFEKSHGFEGKRIYWIRENVLRPIFKDLLSFFNPVKHDIFDSRLKEFTYSNFKKLLSLYAKTNKEISKEIIDFVYSCEYPCAETETQKAFVRVGKINPEFYTYYGAYDWVVFCWLFGKMIDLPKGFPMYSKDLKELLDEKVSKMSGKAIVHFLQEKNAYSFSGDAGVSVSPSTKEVNFDDMSFLDKLKFVKTEVHSYPKQENEHNALADAHWNKKLYEFLQTV